MRFFTLLMLMILTTFKMNSQSDTLYYIGDPMCSWCYGFAPELDQVRNTFKGTPFIMIMGGLRAGGKETLGELSGFLKEHWEEINKLTNQKFKYDILNKSNVLYDTEPACRAIIVVEALKPEAKYDYFKAVQQSFYYYNDQPGVASTYAKIAIRFGIDEKTFLAKFNSQEAKQKTQADFTMSQQMGARGFPTLMAKIDGKLYLVSNGFQKADRIISALKNKGLK